MALPEKSAKNDAETAKNIDLVALIEQAIAKNKQIQIGNAKLRIEIRYKELANGEKLYYGVWRERNKTRRSVGYLRWSEIPQERKDAYQPRDAVANTHPGRA